jgi:hypothetical protein
MSKLSLTSLLELRGKERTKLGSGMEHDVYAHMTDPNIVFKIKNDNDKKINIKWVRMFEKYPDMFPMVRRIGKNYVALEKLDTRKALREYSEINDIINEDLSYAIFSSLSDGHFPDEIDNIFDSLKNTRLRETYYRWRNLIITFLNRMPSNYFSDLHDGQFGYSKDGKLKILDF